MILKKRTDEKLGEILIRLGIISNTQLQQALEHQKADGGLVGEVLIKLGFVNEREIAQAITSQYGFPFIPLENFDINPDAVKLVPEEYAKKNRLVAMDVIGDILIVAMSNPLNSPVVDEIEALTKKKVQVFLSTITSVNEVLNKIYSQKK
jgi:hypothetical protein